MTTERHPAVAGVLRFFEYTHLPHDTAIYYVAADFAKFAAHVVDHFGLPSDPELTVALRKLLEAKDAAVRCAVLAEKAARGSDAPIVNPSEFVGPGNAWVSDEG